MSPRIKASDFGALSEACQKWHVEYIDTGITSGQPATALSMNKVFDNLWNIYESEFFGSTGGPFPDRYPNVGKGQQISRQVYDFVIGDVVIDPKSEKITNGLLTYLLNECAHCVEWGCGCNTVCDSECDIYGGCDCDQGMHHCPLHGCDIYKPCTCNTICDTACDTECYSVCNEDFCQCHEGAHSCGCHGPHTH